MYRIWMMFDPRRMMIAMAVFLAVLAFFIHFLMLSTDRFNWIEGPRASVTIETPAANAVARVVAVNSSQTIVS
ncbi:MAG: light-harvesting antenna LH1, alpha subunit [Gammaproteobacteria bacterium]